MNILILNWKDIKNPNVGGAEIIVYELAKRLVRDGHKVTWFCQHFDDCMREDKYDGIKIVRKGNTLTMYPHAVLYYLRLFPKPDIVLDMSNTIFWQTPLWVKNSKNFAYLNQLGGEVFNYEYPWMLAKIGRLIERLQYLSYKHIPFICYSLSTKFDLMKMGIPKENIHLFTMGLDHSRYEPGEKADAPLFLCVSRLVKMKRTDLVIRAMEDIVKKHPKAKLIIIGYGYERKRLERLRNKLGLQKNIYFQDENVLFFNKDRRDQKVKLMQQAWALVFPSIKEGWGMTVTECAACGTPAIVTDVTGLRDSVQNHKTGIILSKDPIPQEISRAINRLIEDKKLRESLSENALEWSKNFSWEKAYKEFKNIILD